MTEIQKGYSAKKSQQRQLFLLHFAGGSKYSYEFLKSKFPQDIAFLPLELPGRGGRMGEALLKDKTEAVQDYLHQIQQLRNSAPYVIYGHSMGATLSLELVKELESLQDAPEGLIVSGNPGPDSLKDGEEPKPKRYLMDDVAFKKELLKLGGIPSEVLENKELYQLFSPIMRADFEIVEKEEPNFKVVQIPTPIYALMGTEENNAHKIDNWKRFTLAGLTAKTLGGNHFFIHDYPKQLAQIIMDGFDQWK